MSSTRENITSPEERSETRKLSPDAIGERQLERLNRLLAEASLRPFYRERLAAVTLPLKSLDQLASLPLLVKSELEPAARPLTPGLSPTEGGGAGTGRKVAGNVGAGEGEKKGERDKRERSGSAARVFDLPPEQYVRFHQTSGTRGWPLPVLDTADDWQWWIECWQYVLDAADVTCSDVAMMAFSFGPFIGFWTAHDALVARGTMVIPGGGMSSETRLKLIIEQRCSVLCCTPTYALHLANVADELGIDLANDSFIRRIIVAGEPGGSIASIRQRIETAWGGKVVDHSGASEIGAWGFGCADASSRSMGLHVIETEFIAECLVLEESDDRNGAIGRPAADGELAELVLTSLGRRGGPVIRYRTGDIVRGVRNHGRECRFLWLDGGVLGRSDDMMVIRGVNVFPSSIESIVREVSPTAEFRLTARRQNEMDQLELDIESGEEMAGVLSELLRDRLSMRVAVRCVETGSLPRFEAKARRWVDLRNGE